MKLIKNNNFIKIEITNSDYRDGSFRMLKKIFGRVPTYIPSADEYKLDPILYGPFTKKEILEGEEQLKQFLDQFDNSLNYI